MVWSIFKKIITTGRAGGLHKPPLGHVPGRAYRLIEQSANRADFPGMPLKGAILLAFFYRLTRKRVDVLFDTHLIICIVFL